MQLETWGDYVESIGTDQILKDHENRIQTLEKNYDQMQRDIAQIQNGQLRIETTFLQESRDQKNLLNKLIDQKFDLDKTNLTSRWKFILTACGSGGIFVVVLLALFELIKGAFK